MATVIVVEDLVGPAVLGRGGHALHVLQFLEGLRRAGHEVIFIEFLDRGPTPGQRRSWEEIFRRWWPADHAALLDGETGESHAGLGRDSVARWADRGSAVIQLAASYRSTPWPIIGEVRPRVLIDGDPAYTHLWAAAGSSPADIWGEHDVHFTVGLNIGSSRCAVPTLDIHWRPIAHWVVPDWWPAGRPVTRDRFTTVGAWRDYGYLEFEGRMLGPKVEEFEAFLDLPARLAEPVELTLAIDPDDPDLDRLAEHGWIVSDPSTVSTPERFRDYVAGSLGEFSCAKGGYVGTRSGWFSDRSAAYLAAGRPVVVQATGFEDVLPVGEGLFAVTSTEEAVEAMRAIRSQYERHSRAAREIAHRYMDAERLAATVLDACGIASPA